MNDNNKLWLAALVVAACLFRVPAHAEAPASLPPVLPPPVPTAGAVLPLIPPPMMDASFPQGIRLTEFARVVLQDVLKKPFIFSSDFLQSPSQVGFSAKELKAKGSEALLRDVLSEHGFTLQFSSGYYRIAKVKESDKPDLREDFYYRPKHRDLAYLSRILQPLFPQGGFTYQRQADVQQSPQASQQTGGQASQGQRPVDTGGSLYSMTTGTDGDAFVFRGLPKDIARLQSLLTQVDIPVPRVLVRAIILEVQSRESQGFSVSAVGSLLAGRLGFSIQADAFTKQLTFKSGDFNAVASALASDGTVKVVTAPSVYAETGAQAQLSVGASVPTLGAIQYNGNGQSQQSVQYQDTGVILSVTPRVLDDAISLSVKQEISDAVSTTTGVQNSPTLTKRSLSTVLNMASGDWVILGGLTTDKDTNTADSLPFWRSFKTGTTKAKDKVDIVVLLYVERT